MSNLIFGPLSCNRNNPRLHRRSKHSSQSCFNSPLDADRRPVLAGPERPAFSSSQGRIECQAPRRCLGLMGVPGRIEIDGLDQRAAFITDLDADFIDTSPDVTHVARE